MLKDKEDNFLGDQITNNIKYADNEWQALGTTDRTSMYLSEPILDLIFENQIYDRDTGKYKYIPRASIEGKKYSAATLSHDLILVNKLLYSSTPKTPYNSIYNLDDYLGYGIVITNPIYDNLARVKKIPMFETEANGDKLRLKYTGISSLTLKEFVEIFNPYSFSNAKLNENALNTLTLSLADDTQGSNSPNNEVVITNLLTKYPAAGSINDTTNVGSWFNAMSAETQLKFIDDFSLSLHDKDSVKIPYYTMRGISQLSGVEKFKFFSRLYPNLSVINKNIAAGYVEKMSTLAEDYLSSNLSYGSAEDAVLKGVAIDQTSSAELQLIKTGTLASDAEAKTQLVDFDILPDDDIYDVTNCVNALSSIADSFRLGGYNKFLPPLFLGYTDDVNFKDSAGIHLVIEEDKSTVFREDDVENFTIYSGLVLGYRLVDNLISQRTFLGSMFNLIFNSAGASNNATMPNGWEKLPLNKMSQKKAVTDFAKDFVADGSYKGYVTVDMLGALFYLGHSDKTFTDYSERLREMGYFAEDYTDFMSPIQDWLENETFLFKAPIYGDYVEELQFMQDLHPDANPQFTGLRIKKTDLKYKRFQDSKYEHPYVEGTLPLINLTPGDPDWKAHATEAIPALGIRFVNLHGDPNARSQSTVPPFLYDYDKDGVYAPGNKDASAIAPLDARSAQSTSGGLINQRVNHKEGDLEVEGRIKSKTIEELWQYLKYLSESTGIRSDVAGTDLPSFFGIYADQIGLAPSDNSTLRLPQNEIIRVNPRVDSTADRQIIDILDWEPIFDTEHYDPYYNSKDHPEYQLGGYKVNKAITKVIDYAILPFSRSLRTDGDVYEYGTETGPYMTVTGYLTQLWNNFELGLAATGIEGKALPYKELDAFDTDLIFVDENVKRSGQMLQESENRRKAFNKIATLLNWSEGESRHNHFKEYLEHPKNLKTIERDLESIRQNLQMLSEYAVLNFAVMGFADRGTNRGTLHTLHRNSFDFNDAYLEDASSLPSNDTLNNVVDTLNVVELDKKVVFADGDFATRYKHDYYDASRLNLSDPKLNVRTTANRTAEDPVTRYAPNITLLSEVYLAGDGTWRSVHEHLVAPIIDDEF